MTEPLHGHLDPTSYLSYGSWEADNGYHEGYALYSTDPHAFSPPDMNHLLYFQHEHLGEIPESYQVTSEAQQSLPLLMDTLLPPDGGAHTNTELLLEGGEAFPGTGFDGHSQAPETHDRQQNTQQMSAAELAVGSPGCQQEEAKANMGDTNRGRKDGVRAKASSRKDSYRIVNRAAAKRCRERTRYNELSLVSKEREAAEKWSHLKSVMTALEDELILLKNHILQHSGCEYEPIQKYIARTADTVSNRAFLRPEAQHWD